MSTPKLKIVSIVGARPNYMKMAPIAWQLEKTEDVEHEIIHTGQHYSGGLEANNFWSLLRLQASILLDIADNIGVVERWQQIQNKLYNYFINTRPDFVLVYGDVDSTLVATLAAKSAGCKIAHIESGLRSFDANMPEERNRFVVDHLADLLFVTEESGVNNLHQEAITKDKIFFVGNTMIDCLYGMEATIKASPAAFPTNDPFWAAGDWILCTFHRPENVDTPEGLAQLSTILAHTSAQLPVLLPLHPRTRAHASNLGFLSTWKTISNLYICEPADYVQFQSWLSRCKLVITDSGGLQEEACFWNKTCFTFRKNTERPATIAAGWNRMVEISDFPRLLSNFVPKLNRQQPPLWDGQANIRIVEILKQHA